MDYPKKTLESDGLKVEFSLSEIPGNEYKKILPISMEEVRSEFNAALKANKFDPAKVVKDKLKNLTATNYGKAAIENYYIEVKSEDEAEVISKMKTEGFKISTVSYIFTSTADDYGDEMSIEAIQDAKRKANNIAKAVGKEVGAILNIEDMKNINSSATSRYAVKSNTQTISYRVNVTFELK